MDDIDDEFADIVERMFTCFLVKTIDGLRKNFYAKENQLNKREILYGLSNNLLLYYIENFDSQPTETDIIFEQVFSKLTPIQQEILNLSIDYTQQDIAKYKNSATRC